MGEVSFGLLGFWVPSGWLSLVVSSVVPVVAIRPPGRDLFERRESILQTVS